MKKPTREQLGMSPSSFKTLLRRRGYKVPRDFFSTASSVARRGRLYRFRWWSKDGFVVDQSCGLDEFDRWANSTDQTMLFTDWLARHRAGK